VDREVERYAVPVRDLDLPEIVGQVMSPIIAMHVQAYLALPRYLYADGSSSAPIGCAAGCVAVAGPSTAGNCRPPVDGSGRKSKEFADNGWRELAGVELVDQVGEWARENDVRGTEAEFGASVVAMVDVAAGE
jgi:hypothetical protein